QEYVHINAVQPNGVLFGVTRYRFDEHKRMLSSSFARRAQYEGGYWQLEDVATTHFHERSSEVVRQEQERWDVELTPQLLGTVVLAP
ncbi:LptF/LptG family permease, partial [Pseudoalteromonas shioyasakiensis]|uniref:LptF/LptG family permease n=1 Tax=Pseudoalteromonas shioyasakiensis TaxID=1190813 RepID=UPI0022B09BF1